MDGGTRVSPGSGGGLAGHGAPIHPSILPSPAAPSRVSHAGPAGDGQRYPRPGPAEARAVRASGCTATRCCHLSLGLPAASPNSTASRRFTRLKIALLTDGWLQWLSLP